MNQPHRKFPFIVLLLFLCPGTGAAAFAFWLVDHRQAIPGLGIILAVSFGIFLMFFTGALFTLLRWRDGRRAVRTVVVPSKEAPQQNLEGTVYGLVPGNLYQVIKSFTDYYGNSFERGDVLRFKQRHFLPYDGGHTIMFEERPLYLQEEKDQEILDHFSEYIVQLKQ